MDGSLIDSLSDGSTFLDDDSMGDATVEGLDVFLDAPDFGVSGRVVGVGFVDVEALSYFSDASESVDFSWAGSNV